MRRGASWAALVVAALVVAATGGGPVRSLARFTSVVTVAGNEFVAAPDWTAPTVSAFTVGIASDTRTAGVIRRGTAFHVYADLDDTGAPASGVAGATVDLRSVVPGASAVPLQAGSYIAPGGGTAYAYRSAQQVADGSIAPGTYPVTVRTVDRAGNVGLVARSIVVSTTYVLMGSAGQVSTSCPSASGGQYDMELGYVPAGPERSRTGPGPRDVVSFCSDTFTAGSQIPAGTAEVTLSYQNTIAKACNVTTTLWRGATSLGSATRSIPANTVRTTGTWSLPTVATTFAAGERLALTVEYQAGNLCNGSTFWWDSAAAPSKVVLP